VTGARYSRNVCTGDDVSNFAQTCPVRAPRLSKSSSLSHSGPRPLQVQLPDATTLEAITRALNDRGIRPARGTRWYASSVANLLSRASKLAEAL
jgi:Recombinase